MSTKQDSNISTGANATCFVIMPISAQSDYDEGHFTLVYEDIIRPAIETAGMIPTRADETKNTNLIQLDILKQVIGSKMAVCDMSARNANVFYELGMRQAFDLPTVLMRDDSTDAPFDVSGLRYVTYKRDMRYRDVRKAIEDLTSTIKATFEKRDDKTEVNSLIRLMQLTRGPATINPVEMTEEQRNELINDIQLAELSETVSTLAKRQEALIDKLDDFQWESKRSLNLYMDRELDRRAANLRIKRARPSERAAKDDP